MTTKFLLSRDAQLACGSTISARLTVRAIVSLRGFACAMEWFAGAIAIHRSAVEQFSSICWSAAG
jgi:hypothetical protein